MNYNVSQRIIKLKANKRMNQLEFVKYLGIIQPTLSAYKRDITNPSIDVLQLISDKCNVSIGWLLGERYDSGYNSVSEILSVLLDVLKVINKDYSVKVCDNTISFDFSDPSGNDTENSVSAEITSFFREYAEMKEKLSSLPDKEFSDFAKDYYDMWLEKKLSYYATIPVQKTKEPQ